MAQRVLEPGQIETLTQRSIPRVRLPDRLSIFSRRAARLCEIARGSTIGGYLEMLALIAGAQHEAIATLSASPPGADRMQKSREHGMPPMHAASWPRTSEWQSTLERICEPLKSHARFPRAVSETVARIRSAAPAWRETQADALLEGQRGGDVDVATAPFFMAALQVHFTAMAGRLQTEQVQPIDVHGVCPLCGSLPVVSIVYARAQFQGYRYLHCGLCATEWHMVRVQCTCCNANGKDIAYHTLGGIAAENEPHEARMPPVRAETCERCRRYRKILYEEQDPRVEPLADDLGTLSLDILLNEQNYHRASGNPMLWMPESR